MKKQLKKIKKLNGRIKREKSKTRFECRVITNPVEIKLMGYTPSKNCWMKYRESKQTLTHQNDYEVKQVMKKVA
tara:strand:- start:1835 stop:2056 length:222 start_codon:yes stop_codon:yes gene_type:complete